MSTSPLRATGVNQVSTTSNMARATTIVDGVVSTGLGGSTAVALEGHTTGNPGSSSEERCQAIGNAANWYINEAQNTGDWRYAQQCLNIASDLVNMGLDEGCFFID